MNSYGSLAARWLTLIAMLGVAMFGFVPIAEAHTDFESSTPSGGEVVNQPVVEIRLRFTAASIAAGDGFVVLTPSGELVKPEVRVSNDEQEFTLRFEQPLTDGVVGVQWSVRAGDAHPIEGAFSFTTTATAPAPIDSIAVPPVDEPPAQVESPTVEDVAQADPATSEVASSGELEAPVSPQDTPLEISSETSQQVEVEPSTQAPAAMSLDEFLNTDTGSSAAGPLGYLGRLASQVGSLVAIGVLGFVLLVGRRPNDTRLFIYLIRQAAAVTLLGAVLRAIALVVEFGGVSDALISSTGLAVGLRAAGATGLLLGSTSHRAAGSPHAVATVRVGALSAVGGGSFASAIDTPANTRSTAASRLQTSNPIGPIAPWSVAAIALSFVFDGHTVTKGYHLLTGLVAVVHVVGGAVWLGGLICLVLLARRRSSDDAGSDFVTAVVRFSVVAAVALAAVGAAGLMLTVTILDSVSELWTTAWGRILIAKVLIVAVAVAAGAFNHFVLVPKMTAASAHGDARQSFVRTMMIELVALGLAVVLTAFLVAAAS